MQIAALETSDLASLGADQIGALGTAQIVALSTRQIAALGTDDIAALTGTQAAALTTTQLAAFSTRQIAALETGDLVAMSSTQIASLSSTQFAALTTEQIQALQTTDIVAMSTLQAAALTTAQIVALTTEQVAVLETRDIAAMSMTQAAVFEQTDIDAMSEAQRAALAALSPIVLDLDGDGVRTLSASAGVRFDLLASGQAHATGWVSATDGLLVRDLDGNGRIDDGRELFGVATRLDGGQIAGNGYVAMQALDSNGDGRLDAKDAAFGELRVWVDADSDGLSSAAELHGLVDLGIVSLDLNAQAGTAVDQGNLLGLVSGYTRSDGSVHAMADVWFARGEAAPAPALDELLVEAPATLPGASEVAAAAPQASAAVVAAVIAPNATPALDELLRQQPLL